MSHQRSDRKNGPLSGARKARVRYDTVFTTGDVAVDLTQIHDCVYSCDTDICTLVVELKLFNCLMLFEIIYVTWCSQNLHEINRKSVEISY